MPGRLNVNGMEQGIRNVKAVNQRSARTAKDPGWMPLGETSHYAEHPLFYGKRLPARATRKDPGYRLNDFILAETLQDSSVSGNAGAKQPPCFSDSLRRSSARARAAVCRPSICATSFFEDYASSDPLFSLPEKASGLNGI